MENKTILSIKNVSKGYPGVQALKDASLDVYEGEVHALIGENGAGKSTLIKMISGAEQPDEGIIEIFDKQYAGLTPHLSRSIGVATIYQEFNLFPTLSVCENIFMGEKEGRKSFVDFKTMRKKADNIFEEMRIEMDSSTPVENLTTAYMQLVEIAKSLSKEARILIMDEPTAPLSNHEVETLFQLIRHLKQQGVTIIYISHRLGELFEIADRLTVMRDGEVIITANTTDMTRAELIRHMVNREMDESHPKRDVRWGKTMLEVKNLCGNGLKDISFSVRSGEILGLAGLVGAGRTELSRLIFGADSVDSGHIFLDGAEVTVPSPKKAVELGIGLVPEDRKHHGAILEFSIRQNISLPILKRLSNKGFVNFKDEEACVDEQCRILRVKTPSIDQLAKNLSGGNQQKVVLAKWLASQSKVLFLDEPTRGVDVGAKQEIYQFINQLADEGIAIVLISSDMEELLGMSDRLMVLCEGNQVGFIEKEDFSQQHVLSAASGNL